MSGAGKSTFKASAGDIDMDNFIMGSEHIANFSGAETTIKTKLSMREKGQMNISGGKVSVPDIDLEGEAVINMTNGNVAADDDVVMKGQAVMKFSNGGFIANDDVFLEGDAKLAHSGGTFEAKDLFEFKENAVIEINGEKATAIMTEVSGNATQFLLKKGEAKIQQFTCSTDDPFKNDGAIVNTNTAEPTPSSQTSTLDANPKAIDKLLNQTKIIGNFVQSSGGTLAMNISSASNSKLVVNGNATLGGNLNVTKSANKVFALNDSFNLIKADNITGTFSKVTLPELASGLQWDTSSLYSDGSVKVTTSAHPQPHPAFTPILTLS